MVGYPGGVWDEPAGPKTRGCHLFNRLYRTVDGWLFLAAARSDGRRLLESCSIVAGDTLPDEQNLENWLEAKCATLPTQTCVTALTQAGFSAHRHASLTELASDAYVAQQGYIAVVNHTGIGRALGVGLRVYNESPQATAVLAARRPGMDTLDILKAYGFEARIGDLLRDKVVAIGEASILNTPQTPGYWGKIDLHKPALLGGLAPTREIINKINDSTPFSSYLPD